MFVPQFSQQSYFPPLSFLLVVSAVPPYFTEQREAFFLHGLVYTGPGPVGQGPAPPPPSQESRRLATPLHRHSESLPEYTAVRERGIGSRRKGSEPCSKRVECSSSAPVLLESNSTLKL